MKSQYRIEVGGELSSFYKTHGADCQDKYILEVAQVRVKLDGFC